ncbi:MAG TPA: ribonuclease J [Erysipelotrichaceae bacterium]|nr:ribonuclease J [Erysipelotrichaceae bacterium]
MTKSISMPVSIYALGGLGEVGKNMYCIENEKTLIIIDAGVRFPGAEFPGIDYIIPDFTHLKNNRKKVKALFITHGHEDHIGAIPFLVKSLNVPVIYAPRLAMALIRNKFDENRISDKIAMLEYEEDTVVNIDSFTISFFRVTHSIPDSYGIVIDTSEGRIITTGDFKVDLTPIGPDINLTRMAQLGDEGVDLLLSDSTNAEDEGVTPSEKNVLAAIDDIFAKAPGRLVISTFSSNISRIQQICDVAYRYAKKIVILGRSMERSIEISRSYGYIKIPDDMIIEPNEIKNYKSNQIVVICTGSQGEPMAALSRIAKGDHRDIHIAPGDTVVFSSSAIPGNGLMIDQVVNQLARCGADVVTDSILNDIHSSGHPSKQELRLVIKLFKPTYFMPVHGEYRMLLSHAKVAVELGIPKENCFVLDNGDVLTLTKKKVRRAYQVDHGCTYIDGKDIKGLADAVMADRRILTSDGMVVVTISIDSRSNELIDTPLVMMKGVVTSNTKSHLVALTRIVDKAIKEKLLTKTNFSELKNIIRDVTDDYLFGLIHSRPMVIPVILTKN